MSYILCIDAGTSRVKVVIFDENGEEIYLTGAETQVYRFKTESEINMNQLWAMTADCIRQAMVGSRIMKDAIGAVVVTGQGEGLWLVDKSGNPLRNAILWDDGRASGIVDAIKEDEAFYDDIKRTTGSYPKAGSTIVLLKWLKENHPEEYEKIHYCFSCKDWLRYKLTAAFNCEITDASTSYLDLETKLYPGDIFRRLNLEGAESLFPVLVKPMDICGTVTPAASEETLLPSGAYVAGGMLDIVATSVGAGAVHTGDVCSILGTSCINEITTDRFVFERDMTGWECHIADDLYINVAGSMSGTPNLDWGLRMIMGSAHFDDTFIRELEKELSRIPVGSNGIIYHPYISLSGERAPFYNPQATGQISGFNISTTKYDLMKSIYEGVALSSKDCLSKFRIDGKIYLTGGGSKSLFWAQLMADCIGKEIVISEGEEFSAKGGGIAAGIACGMFKSLEEAVGAFCRVKHILTPDSRKTEQYNRIFEIFREMRIGMDSFWSWRSGFLRDRD